VAIKLLTEESQNPSGAHWFWTRVIPEMAKRLESGEKLHLVERKLASGGPTTRWIRRSTGRLTWGRQG
jgi:hypothetical protein